MTPLTYLSLTKMWLAKNVQNKYPNAGAFIGIIINKTMQTTRPSYAATSATSVEIYVSNIAISFCLFIAILCAKMSRVTWAFLSQKISNLVHQSKSGCLFSTYIYEQDIVYVICCSVCHLCT